MSLDIHRHWKSTHFRSLGEMPIKQLYDNTQMYPEVYGGPVCFSFYGMPICLELIPADDGLKRMAVMLRIAGDPLPKD